VKGLLFPTPVDPRYAQDEVHSVVNVRHIGSRSPIQHACLGIGWYVFIAMVICEAHSFTRLVIYSTGHAIVATIAELHLDSSVLPILCSILEPSSPGIPCTLASFASWADDIKDRMKWSKPMHYVNAIADHPPQLCLFPGAKGWEGEKDVNVLGAIRNATNFLSHWVDLGSPRSDPIASDALKFLIHFVGDMHMPLHLVGRETGGNSVYVKWSGRKVSK
jgi:hypothetical protein